MKSLHEALHAAAAEAAEALSLSLGWTGETFTPPVGPHLRGEIVYASHTAASCGWSGLTRVDGRLELGVVTAAGSGDGGLAALAGLLSAHFPRGKSVACAGGEAVFAVPGVGPARPEGGRLRVLVTVPFYALLEGGKK